VHVGNESIVTGMQTGLTIAAALLFGTAVVSLRIHSQRRVSARGGVNRSGRARIAEYKCDSACPSSAAARPTARPIMITAA
jgi:hypothetical protein